MRTNASARSANEIFFSVKLRVHSVKPCVGLTTFVGPRQAGERNDYEIWYPNCLITKRILNLHSAQDRPLCGAGSCDFWASSSPILMLRARPDCSAGVRLRPVRYVTTPDADHLVRLHRRPELRPLYRTCAAAAAGFPRGRTAGGCGCLLASVAPGSDLTASC